MHSAAFEDLFSCKNLQKCVEKSYFSMIFPWKFRYYPPRKNNVKSPCHGIGSMCAVCGLSYSEQCLYESI